MLDDETFAALGHATVAFANLTDDQLATAKRAAVLVEGLFEWIDPKQTLRDTSPIHQRKTYQAERDLLRRALAADRGEWSGEWLGGFMRNERHWMIPELTLGASGFELKLPAASVPGVKTSWLLFLSELMSSARVERQERRERQDGRERPHVIDCNLVGCNRRVFRPFKGGRPKECCCEDHEKLSGRNDGELRKRTITIKHKSRGRTGT